MGRAIRMLVAPAPSIPLAQRAVSPTTAEEGPQDQHYRARDGRGGHLLYTADPKVETGDSGCRQRPGEHAECGGHTQQDSCNVWRIQTPSGFHGENIAASDSSHCHALPRVTAVRLQFPESRPPKQEFLWPSANRRREIFLFCWVPGSRKVSWYSIHWVDRPDLAALVSVRRCAVRTDRQLSDVLSEFARTLVTDFPIQSILDHLVVRIAELLPISSVGVTLISEEGDARHIAASDESAQRFVQLQAEMGEGPCLTAHYTGEVVVVPELRDDEQFPKFSRRGLEEGLRAVFSIPLKNDEQNLGALDLYRTEPGLMDDDEMYVAQTLADVTTAYLLNAQSRAELEDSSERARQSALHDPLTGLPNRTLLVQRLDHAILRCRRSEKMLAVFFADLDQFKQINDTFGHHVGDELLVAVADRLTGLLRPGDTLARLSGDEFVILCEDLEEVDQVEPLASRISNALAEPFVIGGNELQVSASVGIAFAGLADDVPESIIQEADGAMYEAKRSGGARHTVIDLRDRRAANHLARLNRDLTGALRRGELRVVYQPIVLTGSGRMVGAEALLRWVHPAHGTIKPATVIPLAEQSGLITEIGHWLMTQACLDRQRWQGNGDHYDIGVSINVSVHQLMSHDFVRSVCMVLSETGTEPRLVTLEVTESVLVADKPRALRVLNDLKSQGVMLALDDFGTGQSSLSHLKQFPVDIVKVDREFVTDIGSSPSSRLIVGAVTRLAHELGKMVTAEGVENLFQRDAVTTLDCDFSQGFYFSSPVSSGHLGGLWAKNSTLPRLRPLLRAGGTTAQERAGRRTPADAASLSLWRR
jgi:diguanylate cyclase (GGDEF)-like protein